jgi:hypothetical protein
VLSAVLTIVNSYLTQHRFILMMMMMMIIIIIKAHLELK